LSVIESKSVSDCDEKKARSHVLLLIMISWSVFSARIYNTVTITFYRQEGRRAAVSMSFPRGRYICQHETAAVRPILSMDCKYISAEYRRPPNKPVVLHLTAVV